MAYIETIPPDDADGPLAEVYGEAVERAGKVWQILRIQGSNPAVLAAWIGLYRALMFGPSPLTRIEREVTAVVVSRSNDCFY
ncbi:MAG: carboxymuconolactone decarboxylase family protein [Planctomycetes bacterium]|nr:carboxymuconolactone decarboxylase family protein [Planctomycetota bacterium]